MKIAPLSNSNSILQLITVYTAKSFMFRPSRKLIFACLSGLFVIWAGAAALGMFGQRKIFYAEGREELSDFWMPRMCLEQGYVGHPEKFVGLVDVQNRKPIEISGGDVLLSG